MAGGGRYQGPIVKATDVLPTAEAVALAKGFAAKACCDRAAESAWPVLTPARAWIDLIPVIALAALHAVCPEVGVERLAVCLGLDPHEVPSRLASARRRPSWSEAVVNVVAQQIGGGQ